MLLTIDGLIEMESCPHFPDMHVETPCMNSIVNNDGGTYRASYTLFLTQYAAHLSQYDPNMVFFEILNEPTFLNTSDWNTAMYSMLAAARAGAPSMTLIAGANLRVTENNWDTVPAFLGMVPLASDNNVIYNFHYYDPTVCVLLRVVTSCDDNLRPRSSPCKEQHGHGTSTRFHCVVCRHAPLMVECIIAVYLQPVLSK